MELTGTSSTAGPPTRSGRWPSKRTRRIDEAHVRAGDRHQRGLGDRLEPRKIVDMLWPPKLPLWKQNADGIQTGDMHGLEVLPDRSAVWASSRLDSRIYGWSLPDLKYIGAVEVGPSANWMTPTPDSKFMYVAISGVGPHRGGGPEEARHRRQDQDGRAPGADQHRDPAPGSGQPDDVERAGEAVTAMADGHVRLRAPARAAIGALGIVVIFAVSLAAAVSAERGRRAGVGVPGGRRHRDLPEHRREGLPDGSWRHHPGLRRLRAVPHLADEPPVQPRDARHRRRLDGRAVAEELRRRHEAREHREPRDQPAAAEAAGAGRRRPGPYRRHRSGRRRALPSTRRC